MRLQSSRSRSAYGRQGILVTLCSSVLVLAIALHASGAVVTTLANGDFENDFAPWQALDIGCWGNGVHYRIWSDPAQVGFCYAELGINNSPGGIFQTFNTAANVTYGVSFWGSGFEGQPLHTGYFSVGSGGFDGVVTNASQNIQWSLNPGNLLGPMQFVANRNGPGNLFGWSSFGGYQFTATSGTSTIAFWNDVGSSVRVDNVVIAPISGPLTTSASNGDWNTAAAWSSASVPGPNSVAIPGKAITINPAVSSSPASCVSLSITGSGSLRIFAGQSLSVAGSLDVGAGNTLQVDSGASLLLGSASTSRMSGLVAATGSTLGAATQLAVDSNVNLTGVNLALGSNARLVLASNALTKSDGLTVSNLQATGGSLNLGGGSLSVTGNLEVDNATFAAKNAVAPQALTLVNASLTGTGAVRPTSMYRFSNITAANPTSSTVWSGAGIQMSIGDDGRGGTVVLTASNTYNGPTLVQSGAIQAVDGRGLPTASNLVLNGGVLETQGTFTRSLGPGAGQVDWYAGGFSAQGGKLLVTLGDAVGGPYASKV
jgi:autotransporter-associated beta strand protein